ncbi:MAG: FeoC-like transcriptional regulator [Methanolobus sp.]
MVAGYRFFLKRIASMMDSKENLTVRTIASRLNLRQDEFRDLLNIMEKRGDIECFVENPSICSNSCQGCSRVCAAQGLSGSTGKIKSYRLTDKGRKVCSGGY